MERFFYHSFPRRNFHSASNTPGLDILDSICRNGLLLVPELISWTDPTQIDPTKRTHATQRRVCFTELSPSELSDHAQLFGSFALEFTIARLRTFGALPVIYIPDKTTDNQLHDSTGPSLLANIAATTAVLRSLTEILNLRGETLWMNLTMNTGEQIRHDFNSMETDAIRTYLGCLVRAQGIPYSEMLGALSAMSSLFYPTDNLSYTGPLGYYRQREWRIISGSYIQGAPTTIVATKDQADTLLNMDRTFFSKELDFADGTFTLAAKSHFLSFIGSQHILSLANRIIVPKECLEQATTLVATYGFVTPVVPMGLN